MAKESAWARAKRRWQPGAKQWFNAVRIPWFLAWTIAGLAYAIQNLVNYEWHHAMIMWVVPMFVGLLSLVRLYQAIVALVSVHQWLREDEGEARASLDDVQRYTHLVPAWTRAKYHARRAELRLDRRSG